jgi:hypothetical protein
VARRRFIERHDRAATTSGYLKDFGTGSTEDQLGDGESEVYAHRSNRGGGSSDLADKFLNLMGRSTDADDLELAQVGQDGTSIDIGVAFSSETVNQLMNICARSPRTVPPGSSKSQHGPGCVERIAKSVLIPCSDENSWCGHLR